MASRSRIPTNSPQDWESQILYFMMVDRFRNGNPDNDRPVDDPAIHPRANDHGGDLTGIQSGLDEGYFQDLGVTALWVSPLTRNPDGRLWILARPVHGRDQPVLRIPRILAHLQHRIGPPLRNPGRIRRLRDAAHEEDMNFILDYVANHVHEEHPLYAAHPDWVTSLYLPDGRENTQLSGRTTAHHVV